MLQKCFKSMLIVLFCFCIFTIPVFAQTTIYDMAKTWAEAWQMRNGQQRYDMMSDAMKQKFKKEQGDNNMLIGWSSPWVESYTIKTENTAAANSADCAMKRQIKLFNVSPATDGSRLQDK